MFWPRGNEDRAGPACFVTSWTFSPLKMGFSMVLLRKLLGLLGHLLGREILSNAVLSGPSPVF